MRTQLLVCMVAAVFFVGCSDDDTTPTSDGSPPSDTLRQDGTGPTPDGGAQADGPATDGVGTDTTTTGDSGPTWTSEFSIDQIILYDTAWVSRVTTTNGRVWLPQALRSNAMVYFAGPEDLGNYEKLSATSLLYKYSGSSSGYGYGVQGPATEYKLKSSAQDVTFTWDDQAGFGYNPPVGLDSSVGVTAFAETDTLEFSTTGGVTESVTFDAPAPLDPATFLGVGGGFATEMSLPDGSFDMIIVKLRLDGGSNSEHLLRFVRPADMTLDNGMRKAPIVDSDTLAAAAALGLTPYEPPASPMTTETLTITVVTERIVDNVGPDGRSIPVYAGHAYRMEEPVKQLAAN